MSAIFSFVSMTPTHPLSLPFWEEKGRQLIDLFQTIGSGSSSLSIKEKKITASTALPLFAHWSTLPQATREELRAFVSSQDLEANQTWFADLLREAHRTDTSLDPAFCAEILPKESFLGSLCVDQRMHEIARRQAILGKKSEEKNPLPDFVSSALQFIVTVLNTVVHSIDVSESAQAAHTIWEKSYSLDIVLKLFMIPFALVHVLCPSETPFWLLLLAAGIITLTAGGLLYVYHKYLRPRPQDVPHCENLAKSSKIAIDIGNESAVGTIHSFCKDATTHSKHLLLVAPSGAGKTTAVLRGAKRWKEGVIELINTSSFVNGNQFEKFEDKWNRITKEIAGFEDQFVFYLEELGGILEDSKGKQFIESLNSQLDQENLRYIASALPEQFAKLEKDYPSLLNRFHVVKFTPWEEGEVDAFLSGYWDAQPFEIPLEDRAACWKTIKEKIKIDKPSGSHLWDFREAKELINRIFSECKKQWDPIPRSHEDWQAEKKIKQAILCHEEASIPDHTKISLEETRKRAEAQKKREELASWRNLWQTLREAGRSITLQKDEGSAAAFLFLEEILIPAVEKIFPDAARKMTAENIKAILAKKNS